MPGMDGIEATRRIVAEPTRAIAVLMLTTFDLDEYVYDALRAGASGFLLKDVAAGGAGRGGAGRGRRRRADRAGDHEAADRAVRAHRAAARRRRAALAELTPREHEVLALVARGLSNAEIADELVLSEATVKTHVKRVLAKLGLRDRVQAVVLAYESGLVTPGAAERVRRARRGRERRACGRRGAGASRRSRW